MSTKIVVAISALAAAVALAWWLPDRGTAAPTPPVSTGVIVSNDATTATGTSPAARPAAATRTPVGAPDAVVAAPGPLSLGGHVLVDGERRAPADLAIEVADDAGTARCDSTQATWTFEAAAAAKPPFSLWITSATTAPTRIAVPAEAFAAATFDLSLTSGRTLALTFVDHRTRAPLADLPFEVDKSLELERTGGRVMMRSAQSRHRTDAEGRATVTGVPTIGAVAVRTDLVTRERRLRLRDGKSIPLHRPGLSIWSERVTQASPMRIEVTIATEPVLGEAFAAGAVPAWARPRDGRSSCRVFARQLAVHGGRDDDTDELACSDAGEFSLRATAPSRHAVWLEGPDGRQRLSAETIVAFDHAGAHAPILFEPLAKTAVRLRCTGLPPVGMLTASVAGDRSPARSETHTCTGGSRDFELELASGETVQLRLRAADGAARGETGYQRRLTAAEVQGGDVAIDLRGDFRDLVLPADTPGVAGLVGIALCAVRDGNADTGQMAVAPCRDGRVAEAVFLPAGRWFWRGVGQGPFVLCGVVDVRTGDDGPLALTAATQQVPATELRTPCQLDEVDGVSLRALPGPLRAVPAAGEAATVGMPRRGAWSAVTGR